MLARKLDSYEYTGDYSSERGWDDCIHEGAEESQPGAIRRELCDTALRRRAASLVLMILCFAFYMVMRSDAFIQNGYELTRLKKQETVLRKDIEHLQVVLSQARAPERIASLAAGLGMAPAVGNLYVEAKDGAVSLRKDKTELAATWFK